MEDFEFSVDISDRDWQCFFAQCEECNVLPPALAGLEDSGMSDMDDLGGLFGKRIQKCEIKTYHSQEVAADGPPVCEGSPQELFLGKHSPRGMESVLSGSEEDVHQQSVNMFFENMKSISDCQKSAQRDQVGAMKKQPVKGELSRDGQSANSNCYVLPQNVSKLNSARRIAATGMNRRPRCSVITDDSSSESSTSLYVKHPYLKTKLYIESSSENTANDNIEHHYPLNKQPHSNNVAHIDEEMRKCDKKDDVAEEKALNLSRNPVLVRNGKCSEDKSTQVSQSDSESPYKLLSKESSPCTSIKRKRRKKRRLSVEPTESLLRCERLYSSEDELSTWRRAIDPCFSKDFSWSGLKHQQVKCGFISPFGQYKLSSSLPVGVEAEDIGMEVPLLSTPHHRQYEGIYTQNNFDHTSFTKVWHNTENYVKDDFVELSGITNVVNTSEQELSKVQENLKVEEIHKESVASFSNGNEVQSITNAIFQYVESADPKVAIDRSVRVSCAKSVMREEAETEKVSPCQRATGPRKQLETLCPITYPSCHMVENMTPPPSETAMSTKPVTEMLDHTTRHHASESADSASGVVSAILHNHDLIMDGVVLKTESDSSKEEDKEWENQSERGKTDLIVPHTDGNVTLSQETSNVQEKYTQKVEKDGKKVPVLQKECSQLSHEAMKEPCWDHVEVVLTNTLSEELREPEAKSDHTVFAMSSFWKEMEMLTINDILGCRKEKKAQSSFLPSLQENYDADPFSLSDSGCCSQAEERNLAIPDPIDSNLNCTVISDSSSRSVLWDSEPVPMSPPLENIYEDTLTVNNITEPITIPGLRRMSKKISVQNLCALESDCFVYKHNTQSIIKTLDEDSCNDIGYFHEDPTPKRAKDPRPSSMIENFKLSILDIYSYFFSEDQANIIPEPTTENIVNNFIDGNSVPENYDHFFSEFDTSSFFYTDEANPELVPIFSCSRSSKNKMELHDAYDYFLVSSSDNSSSESDDEDRYENAPIRVVTRFTRNASSKDIVTDAYEHFYTDRDLQEDFFKTTFSFRNLKFTDDYVHKKEPADALTAEPLRDDSKSFHIKAMPITVLENQDVMFPDSLLCSFDNQIITKLQQPLIYQNLQTAVSSPNLDSPLLPLKQSDMCLICIAFASWVLKTADPQAGDAWKAVLLANISALSAIRYLRRYIKGEITTGEKKPNLKSLCWS